MKHAFPLLLITALLAGAILGTSCDREDLETLVITSELPEIDTSFCGVTFEILSEDSAGSVLLFTDLPPASPYTYEWTDGSTTEGVFVDSTGTYGLTVTDALGCWADSEIIVDQIPCVMLELQIFIQDSLSGNELAVGIANGQAPFSYLWSEGSTTSTITTFAVGTFSVTVTDNEGCSGTDDIQL